MARLIIPNGTKYGRLEVIGEAPVSRLPSGQTNRMITCKCECGNTTTVRLLHLVRNRTKSCGCIMPDHGQTGTKLYNCWRGMINRTSNETYIDAHRYINRGIYVCDEWKKFIKFKEWALIHGYEDGLQIDRRDNDKGYSPDNCRFVTQVINMNNRANTIMVDYAGETQSLMLLLRKLNILERVGTIRNRLRYGWDVTKAIETPIRTGNYVRQ